jgi:hypothetical protein
MIPAPWDSISAIASSAAALFAGLAVLIAIIAQRQSQEAQRDLLRPTIVTTDKGLALVRNGDGTINFHIDLRTQTAHLVDLENVGQGPATNIYGVIFGPPEGPFEQSDQRLTLIPPNIITPGQSAPKVEARIGRTLLYGATTVVAFRRRYTLFPDPLRPQAETLRFDLPAIVARLTVTYEDVYRRKHASIFDLTAQGEWISVAFLKNIRHDLGELNRRDREARQG